MKRTQTISQTIATLEYNLAKQKTIAAQFPDAKVKYNEFCSKQVNQLYTGFDFVRTTFGVWVSPYCEVLFDFNDKKETIRVFSTPKLNRLVYLSYLWRERTSIIRFSRLSINMKNNNFKDDMLQSCRGEIVNFIKNNPTYKLDDKHLEPRLKKLLSFV